LKAQRDESSKTNIKAFGEITNNFGNGTGKITRESLREIGGSGREQFTKDVDFLNKTLRTTGDALKYFTEQVEINTKALNSVGATAKNDGPFAKARELAQGKARGGIVGKSGPPPSGTDTIPAMLTEDEFVVNARSSKKHRKLLESINNDTIQFKATGGVIGSYVGRNFDRISRRGARDFVRGVRNQRNPLNDVARQIIDNTTAGFDFREVGEQAQQIYSDSKNLREVDLPQLSADISNYRIATRGQVRQSSGRIDQAVANSQAASAQNAPFVDQARQYNQQRSRERTIEDQIGAQRRGAIATRQAENLNFNRGLTADFVGPPQLPPAQAGPPAQVGGLSDKERNARNIIASVTKRDEEKRQAKLGSISKEIRAIDLTQPPAGFLEEQAIDRQSNVTRGGNRRAPGFGTAFQQQRGAFVDSLRQGRRAFATQFNRGSASPLEQRGINLNSNQPNPNNAQTDRRQQTQQSPEALQKALLDFGNNTAALTKTFTDFNNNLKENTAGFAQVVGELGKRIEELKGLKDVNLKLSKDGKVEVLLNGGAILTSLKGDMEKEIRTQIASAITQNNQNQINNGLA
jgi:hypothetical protein